MSPRRSRTIVLTLLGIPALLAVTEGVSFHLRNRDEHTIRVQGRERGYVLHVPDRDFTTPAPLVISFHGAGLWGAAQKRMSDWDAASDRHGFLVAYPSAATGDGPRVWFVNGDSGITRDVAFVAALIDTLRARYNVDPARVYVNGISNGGGMSFMLSCMLRDRIAAVGMVGAALTLPFQWCQDMRPIPVIAFHGTADPDAPFAGGMSWLVTRPLPRVPTFMANWAGRNHCDPTPRDSAVAPDVTRREWVHCAEGADVVFYMILGGGHTWPGGPPLLESWLGKTNAHISATELMWAFYESHRMMH